MKKYLFCIVIALIFSIVTLAAVQTPNVLAHEILPKNVVEYIQDNPDASPEEVKRYIETNAPDLSGNVKSEQDLLILLDRDTNFWDNSFDFLKLGVLHILDGTDHILFVLSLLLVFVGIATMLKYTLTFTVAHSITIILAGTSLLTLSASIVEPVIALSIAVVALTSVFLRDNKYLGDLRVRLGIIFFFGLFHGLGFAGLLQEIDVPEDKFISSLVSFNIGIEIGQLIIVTLALPVIYLFRNHKYYPFAVKIAAVIIAVIALFWFVERIFL